MLDALNRFQATKSLDLQDQQMNTFLITHGFSATFVLGVQKTEESEAFLDTPVKASTVRWIASDECAQNIALLTQKERDGLLLMREEEKLAHDVYVVLAEKWGNRPFGNIVSSEQTHMKAVKTLLDQYGLEDPIANLGAGKFKNSTLQKLYLDLVKKGSTSRLDALKVGATIEDLDIFDLNRLVRETKNDSIRKVYGNLLGGSQNHLRAFVRSINRAGGTYKPQYISQTEFDQILGS